MSTELLPAPATQPANQLPESPTVVTALQQVQSPPNESSLPKQYQDAYRMKLAGRAMQEIADTFSVDRTTVWRWCSKVEQEAQSQLADEPVLNIIAREVARLTDLEEQARTGAEVAKSDRAKAMYLSEARRAAVSRQNLLTATGIIPRAPEQIFRVTADLKPNEVVESNEERLTRNEAIGQLIDKMQRSRLLG